jgi:MFS family permease
VGLVFGFQAVGRGLAPAWAAAGLLATGALGALLYVRHARRAAHPLLDLGLLRVPTFRASVLGGFLFRVGIGAMPFLLPLMLQLGFGMNPFHSGLITFAAALGALGMKMVATTALRKFGFRTVLVVNGLIATAFLAACAGFNPLTPVWMMMIILLAGGFFRSLEFTSINTIAYADVERHRVSKATAITSVGQQLSLSAGVAVGALAVEATTYVRGTHGTLSAADFQPAFLIVALLSAISVVFFIRLAPDAGAELANRMPKPSENPADASDQRVN